jgi:hypothetical protein
MRTLLKIVGNLPLVLTLTLIAQAKEWRGIVPLRSTRSDVERLLGPPVDAGKLNALYRTENEAISISYATGKPCEPGTLQSGWMVPRDTVVEIRVVEVYDPEKGGVTFRDLGIDTSKYKEEGGGHVPGVSSFTNEEEGVRYELGTVLRYVTRDGKRELEEQRGVVRGVTYLPSAKDKHLKCPAAAPDAPNNGMHPTADTLPVINLQSRRAAGDAGR